MAIVQNTSFRKAIKDTRQSVERKLDFAAYAAVQAVIHAVCLPIWNHVNQHRLHGASL